MKKIKQRNGIKNNIYVASSQGFPGPPSLTTLKIIITYFDYITVMNKQLKADQCLTEFCLELKS